jgi:hypothetical protein
VKFFILILLKGFLKIIAEAFHQNTWAEEKPISYRAGR